jgi:nuclear pore complex protein Nup107
MKANPPFRTKRRRDSGTVKNYLQELEELLQEVEIHVGLIVDEWLSTSVNGKQFTYARLLFFPC